MRHWWRKTRVWATITTVGMCMQVLSGCDPVARDILLEGANQATGTMSLSFINAFFEKLSGEDPVSLGIV